MRIGVDEAAVALRWIRGEAGVVVSFGVADINNVGGVSLLAALIVFVLRQAGMG